MQEEEEERAGGTGAAGGGIAHSWSWKMFLNIHIFFLACFQYSKDIKMFNWLDVGEQPVEPPVWSPVCLLSGAD